MLNKAHFQNVEEFFGAEWLREGCRQLQDDIGRMIEEAWMGIAPESQAHPIRVLWYKLILGNMLPSDYVRGRESHTDILLGQIHRLLTVEYLLNNLRSGWEPGVADDMRNKLHNSAQFGSTLFEMEVADNFRREDHEVQLMLPESGDSADIRGNILGVPCSIECKRIHYKSQNYQKRSRMWNDLGEAILAEVRRMAHPALVNIAFYANPTELDLRTIMQLFDGLEEVPAKAWARERIGRWVIHLERVPTGHFRIQGDLGRFDYLKVEGRTVMGDEESAQVYVVAIQDHVPFDWYRNVRKTLQKASRQFCRSKCNIICLEVADLAYSETPVEFSRIQGAIEDFIERDGRRVSAVLLTISGIIPDGEMTYRSAGQRWLFRNPNPYVALPESFEPPSFNHPRISVKATITDKRDKP